MELSITAEQIGSIGTFPITNSFVTSIITSFMLLAFSLYLRSTMRLIPSPIQNVAEMVIEGFDSVNAQIAAKRASFTFPWFATFFLFILTANWLGLLPGFGTIGFFAQEHGEAHFVPLLRPVNSDLNVTLALALVSLAATHFFSVRTLGIKEYASRFFSLNPINLFVGFLELISEFTKIASLSFRLFGNIFAGEALLVTISKLSIFAAFIIPIPFLVLEVMVGFVQALIFAMLTLVFMVILTTSHKPA